MSKIRSFSTIKDQCEFLIKKINDKITVNYNKLRLLEKLDTKINDAIRKINNKIDSLPSAAADSLKAIKEKLLELKDKALWKNQDMHALQSFMQAENIALSHDKDILYSAVFSNTEYSSAYIFAVLSKFSSEEIAQTGIFASSEAHAFNLFYREIENECTRTEVALYALDDLKSYYTPKILPTIGNDYDHADGNHTVCNAIISLDVNFI